MQPNIMCSCGVLIHPDMPNVVPDMDSADKPLWHEGDNGWHEVD